MGPAEEGPAARCTRGSAMAAGFEGARVAIGEGGISKQYFALFLARSGAVLVFGNDSISSRSYGGRERAAGDVLK